MCHPYPCSEESGKTLGLGALQFEFYGVSEKKVENLVTNQKLAQAFKVNYEKVSEYRLRKPDGYAATSDIGYVSNVVPTIHSWISIGADENTALHNKEFADACMTEVSTREMVNAAVAMAQTGFDIITEETLLREVRQEFERSAER